MAIRSSLWGGYGESGCTCSDPDLTTRLSEIERIGLGTPKLTRRFDGASATASTVGALNEFWRIADKSCNCKLPTPPSNLSETCKKQIPGDRRAGSILGTSGGDGGQGDDRDGGGRRRRRRHHHLQPASQLPLHRWYYQQHPSSSLIGSPICCSACFLFSFLLSV